MSTAIATRPTLSRTPSRSLPGAFPASAAEARRADPARVAALVRTLWPLTARIVGRRVIAARVMKEAFATASEESLTCAGPPVELQRHVARAALDEVTARGSLHSRYRRALARLPQSHRDTLLLCDVAGLSALEAARILETPARTARGRLHAARLAQQKQLRP